MVGATSLPIAVSLVNLHCYGVFMTVDINGQFEHALEALESIKQKNQKPYLSISNEVRNDAYSISPAFRRLQPLLDDPGNPGVTKWKTVGCQILPASCGDYGVGWFMWALRDASAIDGNYKTASTAASFYKDVSDEINGACRSGKLSCFHSLLPFMPHTALSQLRLLPAALWKGYRELVFRIPPPLQDGPSIGTPDQMRDSLIFLNISNYEAPPVIASPMVNVPVEQQALKVKGKIIKTYRILLPVLIPLALVTFFTSMSVCVSRRTCPPIVVIAFAAWVGVATRISLLAVIDVSAFPAIFHAYLSFAFPLSCLAIVASIVSVPILFSDWKHGRGARLCLPRVQNNHSLNSAR
jgi:hypothetical protein